ncbi:MAG: hypothetical protein JO001_11835 [Alphaproteobacteria bacterium]|nr:hypothetical protein [Alphaproteobacteria bacterium]
MRLIVVTAALALLVLAGCGSTPKDSATLVLNDPYWDRVNVEIVITRRADCDSRADGFVETKQLLLRKNTTERIYAPNGATICWRHDPNPNKPVAGAWSDWTKALIDPGGTFETEL